MAEQMTMSEFQRKCSEVVERDVIHNISCLMSHLSENPGDYEEEIMSLTSVERPEIPENVFRVRIDVDYIAGRCEIDVDVLEYDTKYRDWEEGDNKWTATTNFGDEPEFNLLGMSDEDDLVGLTEHLVREGILPKGSELFGEYDEPEVEWEYDEVYEYYIVSSWLADKLRDRGEVVEEVFNMTVWGRTCTGQAISMDWVIQDIVQKTWDIEIVGEVAR